MPALLASEIETRRIGDARHAIKILMVEDCPLDVMLVEEMLAGIPNDHGFCIQSVPRLTDAFSCLDQSDYDVVLLDLNLIDVSGITGVAALHSQDPSLSIIVYSGQDDSRVRTHCIQCGASEYMVKGRITGEELSRTIEKTLWN